MKVDVGAALGEGFHRASRRDGLILVAVFAGFYLASRVIAAQVVGRALVYDLNNLEAFGTGIRIGYPYFTLAVLGALVVTGTVLRLPLKVGAIRVFAGGGTERLSREAFTRGLGRVVVRLVAGTVLYVAAVVVGSFLFVVPGFYLAVALFFFNFEIVVAEKGVLEAFRGSWELTDGSRLWLFVLGAVVAVGATVVRDVAAVAEAAGPVGNLVVGSVVDAAIVVTGIAIAARAYDQLRGEAVAVGDGRVGAVEADDLA